MEELGERQRERTLESQLRKSETGSSVFFFNKQFHRKFISVHVYTEDKLLPLTKVPENSLGSFPSLLTLWLQVKLQACLTFFGEMLLHRWKRGAQRDHGNQTLLQLVKAESTELQEMTWNQLLLVLEASGTVSCSQGQGACPLCSPSG